MKVRIVCGTPSSRLLSIARFGVAALAISLLSIAPASVAAETDLEKDPYDRPGFYVGVGGSYQFNAFASEIEDVIQDEVDDALPGANSSFELDESGGINALVGYRIWSWFAIELQYEWIDAYDIKGSTDVLIPISGTLYSIEGHTLTANTKWILPFWRIQPYFLLGGGVAISDVSSGNLAAVFAALGGDIRSGTHIKPAARVGLGLDFYLTRQIVVNTQASAVLTTLKSPDIGDVDDLNYMSVIASLQYRF